MEGAETITNIIAGAGVVGLFGAAATLLTILIRRTGVSAEIDATQNAEWGEIVERYRLRADLADARADRAEQRTHEERNRLQEQIGELEVEVRRLRRARFRCTCGAFEDQAGGAA